MLNSLILEYSLIGGNIHPERFIEKVTFIKFKEYSSNPKNS